MRYTVTWTEVAENELADIWLQATDRRAVTDAAHQVEQLLRTDAHLRGQDCDGDRVIQVMPLTVFFTFSIDDRRVSILNVAHA